MIIENIIESAKLLNKNILIVATPRSGTHALGSLFESTDSAVQNLGEICRADGTDPLVDIQQIYQHSNLKVAHIVQLSAKIALSANLAILKQHALIINLKRRNKVKQFASWMYFHNTGGVNGKWHNHDINDTILRPGSITVSSEDIDLFVTEQLTDDFFVPDHVLYYEDLTFDRSEVKKNRYSFDLPTVFSNLDYVEQRLKNWNYYSV